MAKSKRNKSIFSPIKTPSLRSRLNISIALLILPLFLLAGMGFFFFLKSIEAFNLAVQDVVDDIIPVTQLKNKIQRSVKPFDLFLQNNNPYDKENFIILSNEIKQALIEPINLDQQTHALVNDIYRSAYLEWRNAHRIALKILKNHEANNTHFAHEQLRLFYQHVISTTLALDKLQLAMQQNVRMHYQKAKELKVDVLLLIGFVFVVVYIIIMVTSMFLNHSIINPINQLEHWASNYSRDKPNKHLSLHSYKEFEHLANTFNKLAVMLSDDQIILEQLIQKDELTQLHNKRSFISRLIDENNRHKRYSSSYSLMLVDVDHLQSVNQNYNHHVGDLTLIQITKLLEDNIRPTDFLARYEGDQFILILPEVEADGANATAERIINSVSEYVFRVNDFKYGVTVSIGFSIIEKNQALSELIQCVDFSLQKAKQQGRNQVYHFKHMTIPSTEFKRKYLKGIEIQ
jgi:diguanylate cyclase (GGDEF)-like protein